MRASSISSDRVRRSSSPVCMGVCMHAHARTHAGGPPHVMCACTHACVHTCVQLLTCLCASAACQLLALACLYVGASPRVLLVTRGSKPLQPLLACMHTCVCAECVCVCVCVHLCMCARACACICLCGHQSPVFQTGGFQGTSAPCVLGRPPSTPPGGPPDPGSGTLEPEGCTTPPCSATILAPAPWPLGLAAQL